MPDATACAGCGTQLAPSLLTCPCCQRLVHADQLSRLAAEAGRTTDPTEALALWRSALELLPAATRQYTLVSEKIAALGRQVDQGDGSVSRPIAAQENAGVSGSAGRGWAKAGVTGLGAIGLLIWKLKTLLLLFAAKGKLLLAGLAKLSTLSSMMLSVGVYATAFGWKLALGLVISIYIHEMGHVAALMRYGVKASAPLFVPGVGALIRLRQALGDRRQDARVGLAGPLWGTLAAAVATAVWVGSGWPVWGAIAKLGASINLFNLVPFGSLDGGRAFRALNRTQRWVAVIALSACWALSTDPFTEGILTLLVIVGVLSALSPQPAEFADRDALIGYVGLAAVLTYLSGITVTLPGALGERRG